MQKKVKRKFILDWGWGEKGGAKVGPKHRTQKQIQT